MAEVVLNLTLSAFPSGTSYTPQQFAQAILDRLRATVGGSNFIFGQLGGEEPTSPLPGTGAIPGLWSPIGTTFYSWNTTVGKYLPMAVIVGQLYNGSVVTTNFLCGATENRILTTPDKDGTIATLDDIPFFSGLQSVGGTTPTLDWTVRKPAYYVLPADSVMTLSGMTDGQVQDLFVENNATIYTLTINGVSAWFGGSAPTITTATAGHRKIDHLRFIAIGTGASQLILGEIIKQNADIATAGGDTTPPTVSTIIGSSTTITVKFNELLQGGSLTTAGFTVRKNGVVDTMVSATASGQNVTLSVSSAFSASDTVTVQYTGTSVKDLAGNLAVAFGPSAMSYATSSGGGGGGPPGGNFNLPY